MKLLTLNCHSWIEENQLEKLDIIAKDIIEKGYDVISLQEVNQLIESKVAMDIVKEDNFALLLMNKINQTSKEKYSMYYEKSHIGYDKYEEGVALLTKHKVKDVKSYLISRADDFSFWKTRRVLKASILIEGKEIDFYSCHLGWWDDEKEPFKEQFDRLYETIDQNKLTFLMGDFNNNAFKKNEGYDYIIQRGLYDTYSLAEVKDDGVTVKGKIAGWDENRNDLRLDLILVNRKIPVKSSSVIFNGINKEVVSDHFGVCVEI
ncbi:endonuclease/exonuclease/phosphatase family protein [Caloramator proteoclasticus]|uniref:Maltose 6'-phosphate phosphatase n=1 Tax=Caloramator proteoclasticus DSM 10124 TaxID=1121262 RepID=A0A1M4YJ76_9CLOT|nr:endonuclease/exonuclease/phosphatase family protein [Caloramator proteoclasticus]SHF05787.1 maltose 6'-phosphate phosphatase [Caloramator proteoclasticus DSM 10124]